MLLPLLLLWLRLLLLWLSSFQSPSHIIYFILAFYLSLSLALPHLSLYQQHKTIRSPLQAFYNEVKCIFRNRLTAEVHKNQFDTILSSACRNLFDIDESNHFFVPSGNQSTALQYTTQQDWTDIVKRNITICSM